MSQAKYRWIQEGEQKQVIDLLLQVKPGIAGMSSRPVYTALTNDAIKYDNTFIIVALWDDKVIGYGIAVRGWAEFKRLFILRHPFVAISSIPARILRTFRYMRAGKPAPKQVPEGIQERVKGYSWDDSDPSITKLLHVGIDKDYRSLGIGTELYGEFFSLLAKEGFRRADGCVNPENLPSIRMVEKNGWTFTRDGDRYFIFKEFE